jgi:hypothetical protein
MRLALHIGAFLVTLFGVDYACSAARGALMDQYLAHLAHDAWWPKGYAVIELTELLLYGMVFAGAGAVIVRSFGYRRRGVVFAIALGLTYSLLRFALEPNLHFVRYSHAPAWLWLLSWSQFYVPVFACAFAAFGSCAIHWRRSCVPSP